MDRIDASTNAAIDRLAATVRWYEDTRQRIFGLVATLYLGTLTVFFGIGKSTTALEGWQGSRLLVVYMLLGTAMALLSDLGSIYMKRWSMSEGAKAEKELGSKLISFAAFDTGFIRESRYVLGYIAGIVFSSYLLAHAMKLV